ncbi:hypothetical protein [Nocardia amikacinitolerans]|uniref:hypothetical protein n=1 Tax=Nocardia amikacinitolerans TaxID=756689 RepID=UPI00082E3736|nr:hypothetical protein [Nocardia amikacinitolerans]
MLGVHVAELLEPPPGVAEALDVVTGFDTALVHGFARLTDEHTAALANLAAALGGSPLGPAIAEAVGKLGAGSIGPEELSALAGGRAALLGAVHDALLDRVDTALGRERAAWEQPEPPHTPHNLAAGSRSWLQEVAITGWRGVDHDLVSAADQTVEALLAEPALRRLAVLLDGLTAELRAGSPVATLDRLPARRWADLWARALLLSWRTGGFAETTAVSGRLLPLGVDVHEHGTAVQVQLYALLETAGGRTRRVRVSIAAAKVDTIVGPAIWQLFTEHPQLLKAIAERLSLDIDGMPMTAAGDLIWHDESARLGASADPFATARVGLAGALAPATPPLDRDPVHLAEPVLVEGYKVKDGAIELDGHRLTLELDRLPTCGPLTPAAVNGSSTCLGLLRWDAGRWSLRPLAVRKKTKGVEVDVHGGDWACGVTDPKAAKSQAKSGDAVAVLRERAGRLLRK